MKSCALTACASVLVSLQQFCGVLGHTFMEFLKGSGDYCQAQHGVYAEKWTAGLATSSGERLVTVLTLAGSGLESVRPQRSAVLDGVKKSLEVHCPRRPYVFTLTRGPALFSRVFPFYFILLLLIPLTSGSHLFLLIVSARFSFVIRESLFHFFVVIFKLFWKVKNGSYE